MKILWVIDKYFDISVDRVTWIETIRHLEKRGHSVTLMTGYRNSKEPQPGIRVKYVGTLHLPWLGSIIFAFNLFLKTGLELMKSRPDILIVDPFSFIDILPIILFLQIFSLDPKRVLDIRTIPVESYGIKGKINNILFRFVLKIIKHTANGLTYITPFMRRTITDTYRLRGFPATVWSSAASTDTFDPARITRENKKDIRQKLQLENKFIVMYHGAMTPARGLFETLQGYQLLDKDVKRNTVLLFIGDGTAKKQMIEWINREQLSTKIRFVKTVPHEEIAAYIASADAGILPFPNLLWWRVSSPIKLMEYLAMEKPVIVTDIEAHRDVLKDASYTVMIPDNSPISIKKGISEAYKNRIKYKKSAKAGRYLIQSRYTWEKQTESFHKFLCDLNK